MGCVWQKVKNGPSCFMKKDSFGYKVDDVKERDNGTEVKLTSLTMNTPYGESIKSVIFTLTYITEDIVRFQV